MKPQSKSIRSLAVQSGHLLLSEIKSNQRIKQSLALTLGFVLAALLFAALICGPFSGPFCMVLLITFAGVFLGSSLLALALWRRKRWVHSWALEHARADLALKQDPRTLEEMETLVEIYLLQGKIEQADKISKRMLCLIEQGKETPEKEQEESGGTISTASGLPAWMNPGEDKDDSKGLPPWLNPP